MTIRRTHIVIPEKLIVEIDKLVGKRGRSQFLVQSAQKELQRLRMLKALDKAAGAWQDVDHPELKNGAAAWVNEMRKGEEDRLARKVSKR
ncbi:MAG: hypothetical protein K2Y22_12590 [Candidatus Obscuribacterales bacterium]|nr:hypothetical protein [Candidatus Obscuribacterales bacterium]